MAELWSELSMAFFFLTWPVPYMYLHFFLQPDLTWTWIYLTDLLRDWTWSEFTYIIFYMNWTWSEKKNLNHPRDCTWSVFFKEINPFFSRDPAVFCKKKVNMFQNNASAQKGWLATYYNNISTKCWTGNSTRQIWIKSVPRAVYSACFKF